MPSVTQQASSEAGNQTCGLAPDLDSGTSSFPANLFPVDAKRHGALHEGRAGKSLGSHCTRLSHHLLSMGQQQTEWPGLWIPSGVNDVAVSSGNTGKPYGGSSSAL